MKSSMLLYKAQAIETLVILGLFFLTYLLLYLYSKKIKNIRRSERFISRAKFIISFLCIILMFFVWIPGFWRFIAVLGFVAGAFVLTQKHNIENLFGFFIISWRSLFVVGDTIKITSHIGKIQSIGLFYFTLAEMKEDGLKYLTGNIIKIPNGFVSKHPLVNYSDTKTPLHTISYVFNKNTNIELAKSEINDILSDIKNKYQTGQIETIKPTALSIDFKFSIKQSDPSGIKLTLMIKASQDGFEKVRVLFEEKLLSMQSSGNLQLF